MFFIFGNHPLQPGCQEREAHLKTFLVNVLQSNPVPKPGPATAFHTPLHGLHPCGCNAASRSCRNPDKDAPQRQRRCALQPRGWPRHEALPGLTPASLKTQRPQDRKTTASALPSWRLCVFA